MRVLVRFTLFLMLLLCGGFVVFANTLPDASNAVPRFENRSAGDVGIVVLTGGGGKRIARGIELFGDDIADRILISGTHPDVRKADLAARFDPATIECCVDLGVRAQTTIGNATEARDWANERGYEAIYLVTDNYHLPRATLELRSIAPDLDIQIVAVESRVVADEWLTSPNTWGLLAREYGKFVLTSIRSVM